MTTVTKLPKSRKGQSMNESAHSPCLSTKGSDISKRPTNTQIKMEVVHVNLASPPRGPQEVVMTPEANEIDQGNFDASAVPLSNSSNEQITKSMVPHGFIPSPFRCPRSRVFIIQGIFFIQPAVNLAELFLNQSLVLIFARLSLTRNPPTCSCSLTTIATRRGREWLKLALRACANTELYGQGSRLFGGTPFLGNGSYWESVAQLVGWWKNNICRKSRFDEFTNEANLLPHIESFKGLEKIQRIRWCKCIVSLVQDIRDITRKLRELPSAPKTQASDFSSLPDEALKNYMQLVTLSTDKLYESCYPQLQQHQHLPGTMDHPICISIEESLSQCSKDDTFVVKLFKVVSDETIKCIQWLTNDSFVIEGPTQLVKEILKTVFQLEHMEQFLLCLNLHGFVVEMKEGIQTLAHPLFVRERSDLLEIMANSSSNIEVWNVITQCEPESEGTNDAMFASQAVDPLPYTFSALECTTQMFTSVYHQLLWEGYSVTSALWLVERLISQRLTSCPDTSMDNLMTAKGGSTRWYKEQSFSLGQSSWPFEINRSIDPRKDQELSFHEALVRFNGGEAGLFSDEISTEAVNPSSPSSAQSDRAAMKPVKPRKLAQHYQRVTNEPRTEVSTVYDLDLASAIPAGFPSLLPPVQSLVSFASSLKAVEPKLPAVAKATFNDKAMEQEGPKRRNYVFAKDRHQRDNQTVPVGKRFQATIPSVVRANSRKLALKGVEPDVLTGLPSEPSSKIFGLIWNPATILTDDKSSLSQANSATDTVSAIKMVLDVAKRRCSFMPHVSIEHQSRLERGDIVIIKTAPVDSNTCDDTFSADDHPCKRRRKGDENCTNDLTSNPSSSLESFPTSTIFASIVNVSNDSPPLFQVYTGHRETIKIQGSQIVSVIDCALPPSISSPLTEEDIWFLLYRNQGDIGATICDVASDWGDDSLHGSQSRPQRLSRWSREDVRKLCQGYRRYGDDIDAIHKQFFRTDRAQSAILPLFMILRPYLRQGQWQQICAVFSRAAQDQEA